MIVSDPATAAVYERFKWADTSLTVTCGPQPSGSNCTQGPSLAPNVSGGAVPPQLSGRVGEGMKVTSANRGFHTARTFGQNYGSQLGFAYSAFVWLNAMPTSDPAAVFWQEGSNVTGIAAYIFASGHVGVRLGTGGQAWTSTCYVLSSATLGKKAWHHVAAVWDRTALRVVINGVDDGSTACAIAPDGSTTIPVSFGARFAYGNTSYVLDGALDEIKYFQFDPGSWNTTDTFLMQEHGLYLRAEVLNYLSPQESPNTFNSPTFHATSLLRRHVSGLYTGPTTCLPLDPLGPANRNGPLSSGVVSYVYPDAHSAPIAAPPITSSQIPQGVPSQNGGPCTSGNTAYPSGSIYSNALYEPHQDPRHAGLLRFSIVHPLRRLSRIWLRDAPLRRAARRGPFLLG